MTLHVEKVFLWDPNDSYSTINNTYFGYYSTCQVNVSFSIFSPHHKSPLLPCASATGICCHVEVNIKGFFAPMWPSVKAVSEYRCGPENWSLVHQGVTRSVLLRELRCKVALCVKWSNIMIGSKYPVTCCFKFHNDGEKMCGLQQRGNL